MKCSSLSMKVLISIRRSMFSTDGASWLIELLTPPTATFWMCGLFPPRMATILLA